MKFALIVRTPEKYERQEFSDYSSAFIALNGIVTNWKRKGFRIVPTETDWEYEHIMLKKGNETIKISICEDA